MAPGGDLPPATPLALTARRSCAGWRRTRLSATALGFVRAHSPRLRLSLTPRRRRSAQPQRNVRGRSRIRITLAGIPPTTALGGTSQVTTELVPITELSPTSTPRSTQAPYPIHTL